MIHLLHAGAVPFGCVRNMSESYISCCDEDYITRTMSCHHLPRTETFPLPDIVLSNTPPSSPGHQGCGSGGAQPNKSQTRPQCSCSLLPTTPEVPLKAITEEKAGKAGLTEVLDTCYSVQSHRFHLPHMTRTTGTLGSHALSDNPSGRQELEEERQWRHIGGDLRKVADHFELNTSKTWRKKKTSVSPCLPATVSRCLVASLICLAWWRLYSKLY